MVMVQANKDHQTQSLTARLDLGMKGAIEKIGGSSYRSSGGPQGNVMECLNQLERVRSLTHIRSETRNYMIARPL